MAERGAHLRAGEPWTANFRKTPHAPALPIQIYGRELANHAATARRSLGVTICKDMDFPGLSRECGRDGVPLVPAWDFDADGWLYGLMAILRGVEGGFSIARAPRQGILSVSDNRGRVLAERSTSAAPFSTILRQVTVNHEATLYSRAGNWFAWCCITLLPGLLVFARPPYERGRLK